MIKYQQCYVSSAGELRRPHYLDEKPGFIGWVGRTRQIVLMLAKMATKAAGIIRGEAFKGVADAAGSEIGSCFCDWER